MIFTEEVDEYKELNPGEMLHTMMELFMLIYLRLNL